MKFKGNRTILMKCVHCSYMFDLRINSNNIISTDKCPHCGRHIRNNDIRRREQDLMDEGVATHIRLLKNLGLSGKKCLLTTDELRMMWIEKQRKEMKIETVKPLCSIDPVPMSDDEKEMIKANGRRQTLENLGLSPNSSISDSKLTEMELEMYQKQFEGGRIVKKGLIGRIIDRVLY